MINYMYIGNKGTKGVWNPYANLITPVDHLIDSEYILWNIERVLRLVWTVRKC